MSDTINYGIDLGTTNSAIAKSDGEEVRIFKNRDQMDVMPSVVRIEKTGRIFVGRRAYQTLFADPDNVVAEFKRWMGQSDRKSFKAAKKSLSAEELSAEVLKSLLEEARRQTGDPITASVITVPAAFGQLQCEATARAATLAGLEEAPLLQEPLAASIAYGIQPDARDKRWLIYDLGGGTFDIAVISTRNGQLSVMEHRGDNMLGGKDIDSLIIEKIFWPRLEQSFNMPRSDTDPAVKRKLIQLLRGKAEETKIDLSLYESVIVSIFNAGNDKDGNPIEAEFEVKRAELNQLVNPTISKTIEFCKQAITGSRIGTDDLETIILVGGPTQMPIVHDALTAEFGIPLNSTIDPMTVVSRGAAIYASTLPLKKAISKSTKPGTFNVKLAHETVWSEPTCLVAGRIEKISQVMGVLQILIEAETGHWNSGWLPVDEGYFETTVHLLKGKKTRFWIYLRDEKGHELVLMPESFAIRHGLTIAEPPLPHSLGAEIIRPGGRNEVDLIFPRSTQLPAHKTISYKANKTLKPSQVNDYLSIKIWEGEAFNDPKANTIVGVLMIRSDEINRPIPEGSEIEVTISINASRLMEVQAFVPVLNKHFQERVYVPKDNEEIIVEKAEKVLDELENHYARIVALEDESQEISDSAIQQEIHKLKENIDKLYEEQERLESKDQNDPDDAKRAVQQSKEIRGQLAAVEESVRSQARFRLPVLLRKIEFAREETAEVVTTWGERLAQKEYELLCREADSQIEGEDEKALDKVIHDFESLKWRVLFKQSWFWKEIFVSLTQSGVLFINAQESQRLIEIGHNATKSGDGDKLEEVVRELWTLQPKSTVESEQEKALDAGIRRKSE